MNPSGFILENCRADATDVATESSDGILAHSAAAGCKVQLSLFEIDQSPGGIAA